MPLHLARRQVSTLRFNRCSAPSVFAATARKSKKPNWICARSPARSRAASPARSWRRAIRIKASSTTRFAMAPARTEILAQWIAQGAPESAIAPDVATNEPDPLVTDKDRNFWAFQPPRRPALPTLQHTSQVRNPIDAFVLQKLEAHGLALSQ